MIEKSHFFGILYNPERVRLTGQRLKVACTEHLTPADFADLNDDFFSSLCRLSFLTSDSDVRAARAIGTRKQITNTTLRDADFVEF